MQVVVIKRYTHFHNNCCGIAIKAQIIQTSNEIGNIFATCSELMSLKKNARLSFALTLKWSMMHNSGVELWLSLPQ